MNISKIQNKILESDEFVLSETRKIQYLYGLKREIRYNQTRTETIRTESVAEHVYGMCIVANYFLPLEDSERKLNQGDIFKLITWHDTDEIETGDVLTYLKTDADRAGEIATQQIAIGKSPAVIQPEMSRLLKNYDKQDTAEARFVKAIDKIEVSFEVLDENYRKIRHVSKSAHDKTKAPYVKNFPYISRFHKVISNELARQCFFTDSE